MIVHGTPYDPSEVELTVAVRVGTRKLEESLRGWIKKMCLGRRHVGACGFETELEPKLLHAGKCRTQSQRCGAAAAQSVGAA